MVNSTTKTDLMALGFAGSKIQAAGLISLLTLVIFQSQVRGAHWQLTPSLTVREIYSDNINFAVSGREDDAFVTELSPGIFARADGGRLRLNFNYRMQNLFYQGTDRPNVINNQLQGIANAELLKNSIFLDANSTIAQVNTSNRGRIAVDNISGPRGNTSEYRTFRISPYWRPHLGGYVVGETRVSYSTFSTGGNSPLSSSDIFEQRVNLQNGPEFYPVSWRLSALNQDIKRDTANTGNVTADNDVRFQNYNGELRYHLGRKYAVFGQGGRFNNRFPGARISNFSRNGSYWTAGAAWTPSPKFALQGAYGPRHSFASLFWAPTRRTSIQVTYRDSKIGGTPTGLNQFGGFGAGFTGIGPGFEGTGGGFGGVGTGFGGVGTGFDGVSTGIVGGNIGFNNAFGNINRGQTWSGLLRHQTRRTTWNLAYFVSTTTIQQLLLEQPVFPLPGQDQFANPGIDPVTGLPFRPIDTPVLTDDVLTRKRGQLSVSGNTAKSNISLTAYQEDRTFQTVENDQAVLGLTGVWNWRFATRVSSILRASWQEIDFKRADIINDFTNVSLGLNRNFTRYIAGYLEYRHLLQQSNRANNEFDENRITASLNIRF
jgi:hypothetical protein